MEGRPPLFDGLAISASIAVSGVVFFYAPDILDQPGWRAFCAVAGTAIATLGTSCVFFNLASLTRQGAFKNWASATISGAMCVGSFALFRLDLVRGPLYIVLLVVSVLLVLNTVYGILGGVAMLVSPPPPSRDHERQLDGDAEETDAPSERGLNRRESVGLLVSVVSMLATVASLVVSILK